MRPKGAEGRKESDWLTPQLSPALTSLHPLSNHVKERLLFPFSREEIEVQRSNLFRVTQLLSGRGQTRIGKSAHPGSMKNFRTLTSWTSCLLARFSVDREK